MSDVRVFVAVRPPPPVVAVVQRALAPVDRRWLRWVPPAQWHVTLRFLGDEADPEPVTAAVAAALSVPVGGPGAAVSAQPEARLGPATGWLGGGSVLQVPVAGLDGLAAVVDRAVAGLVPPDDRRFLGHLTLARRPGRPGGRPRRPPSPGPRSTEPRLPVRSPAGVRVAARWVVTEVVVVASQLGAGAPVHRVVGRVRLPG